MLLNEQEIQGFCLKQSVVDDYTAQVINTLNSIDDPIRRYGVSRSLLDIVTIATKEVGAAMEAHCEKQNIGWDGCDFEHDGCTYRRNFDIEYNYADNATDEEGNPIPYTESCKAVEAAKRALNAKRTIQKAFKELIENAHPNMKPDVVAVSVQLREYMPE